MIRNDFLVAWLVVVTLLVLLVVAGTVFFVWQSGLLSGEVPLVESTAGLEWSIDEENQPAEPGATPTQIGQVFEAKVVCLDPRTGLLVEETRSIPDVATRSQRLLQILGSLHSAPVNPDYRAAVPPELQFRSVFFDLERNLVIVDLAGIPDAWGEGVNPLEVGQALYAVVQTIVLQNPSHQLVQFLVNGRETTERPGGFLLSEPFSPSEDWVKDPTL